MAVRAVRAGRWGALMDRLAETLEALDLGPFDAARVLVATHETGRVVGQEVAARMGVSAGIAYVTPRDLLRHLAEAAGVARDRARWLGTPLDLAVQSALEEVAAGHPLLHAALGAGAGRPGRRRATAVRLARLLRTYADHAPDLVEAWLGGSDAGLGGEALPETAAWQPALLRAAVERLELDPLDVQAAVADAARSDTTPTVLVGVDWLTTQEARVVSALGEDGTLVLLHHSGSPGAAWAEGIASEVEDAPAMEPLVPAVDVHDSHGEARQVEVLRDELTRLFAEDPTLEPREVAVVCPQMERYAPLLDAAFAPVPAGEAHPGRGLRVQPVGATPPNPLVLVLVDLLRLGSTRATASSLVELLLRPAIAHRWRFTDRAALVELVDGSGVRWGMDAAHRAQFGLGDVVQNTWLRGLDRLLIGLAVAPDESAGLGLSGADVVSTTDMDTVGSLCEVVSRLRRLIADSADPATVPRWVATCRAAIDSLVALPRADEWQLTAAARVLTRLEHDHAGDETTLTRHEFSLLLADLASGYRRRPAAGNGSLLVLPLGELPHVEFRVVALLGVTDDVVPGRMGAPADCVDLGAATPDPRERRRRQLLDHARAAERLVIVRQARSERTNDRAALPVAVSWLLEELGVDPAPVAHPPTATSEGNFLERPGFDAAARAGALARRSRPQQQPSRHARRRQQARTRPVGPPPAQVTIAQLSRFLADPARGFLQTAAGVTLREAPELTDDIPLEPRGLERWSILNDLLEAWKSGESGSRVAEALRQREVHPPLEIGRLAFERAHEEAEALWSRAEADWHAELAEHRLDVQVPVSGGVVRVTDQVRTRGGAAVTVTASSGDEQVIRPWLEAVALAAAGMPAPARLHRLLNDFGRLVPRVHQIRDIPPEEAMTSLTSVVSAFSLGQHRLLPVPAAPAIQYAREMHRGGFEQAHWSGPFQDYRSKWPWPARSWRLFYEADVSELFADPPLPEDPQTAGSSAFTAWALALYAPLVRSGA
ncbi:hypothetical protein BCR15_02270 [Tessaracoccus lapidicaptus]|uniref:Uncharacterized protein n=2 Tax=Propionibacteriaceae TaxID=31957 RepID=A0A1C0AMH2_9ACTN|nr:exodeoxyribonuclease V subunit gamma [Tessaracoccus lapidicaptus]AQX14794.1 hypothetical protein BKM78_01745 [Tessaracoccus sp. T2.5-30]OCL34547.1 hypothetical protein BCR15_02270 [Tessaracoccus lapidicaptus]VEP38896.1 RecBCD enzyme subunit RecC [Tessaracoccus lapidicaptus]